MIIGEDATETCHTKRLPASKSDSIFTAGKVGVGVSSVSWGDLAY